MNPQSQNSYYAQSYGTYTKEKCQIDSTALTAEMGQDAVAVIAGQERAFQGVIEQVAEKIVSAGKKIILLTGPSSSGKTTTAKLLERTLARQGHQVYRISLDNFYRPRGELPRWSDGFVNYESIEGLDLPYFNQLIATLKADGFARFPIFDFHTASRSDKQFEVTMGEHTHIIFEGIHALNPLLCEQFSGLSIMRLYVSIHGDFTDGEQITLPARELRLMRRILRDNVRRNATPVYTLTMWDYVMRGEREYINPFRNNADIHINTTHCYEPYVYHEEFLREIAPYLQDPTYGELLASMEQRITRFPPADLALIPPDSLLREFI